MTSAAGAWSLPANGWCVRRREASLCLQPLEGAAWPRLPAASNGIHPNGSQPNGIGRKTRPSP